MTIDARDFGRLEGKLDALLERLPVILDRHEERLRTLEANRHHDAGRQSVLAAGVSLVVAGVTAWLTKHFA